MASRLLGYYCRYPIPSLATNRQLLDYCTPLAGARLSHAVTARRRALASRRPAVVRQGGAVEQPVRDKSLRVRPEEAREGSLARALVSPS